jgi:hypothetical protein
LADDVVPWDDPASREGAYKRWMLDYLLEVKREIWAARTGPDTLRLEDLLAEFAELQARVQHHARVTGTTTRRHAAVAPLSRSA